MTTDQQVLPQTHVLDPVCGMTIDPQDAAGTVEYQGQTYYFCHQSCVDQFRADPERFLNPQGHAPVASPADRDRDYTCPMDPEVRQKGPGPCPKCGMALEPVDASPATRTEWTCPMHPEVVRAEPGACPICGMALEPRVVMLEEANPELEAMRRRFWWSLVLTAPIVALMFLESLPGDDSTRRSQPRPCRGSNWCSPPRWCCGAGCRSSSAGGRRW